MYAAARASTPRPRQAARAVSRPGWLAMALGALVVGLFLMHTSPGESPGAHALDGPDPPRAVAVTSGSACCSAAVADHSVSSSVTTSCCEDLHGTEHHSWPATLVHMCLALLSAAIGIVVAVRSACRYIAAGTLWALWRPAASRAMRPDLHRLCLLRV